MDEQSVEVSAGRSLREPAAAMLGVLSETPVGEGRGQAPAGAPGARGAERPPGQGGRLCSAGLETAFRFTRALTHVPFVPRRAGGPGGWEQRGASGEARAGNGSGALSNRNVCAAA